MEWDTIFVLLKSIIYIATVISPFPSGPVGGARAHAQPDGVHRRRHRAHGRPRVQGTVGYWLGTVAYFIDWTRMFVCQAYLLATVDG